MGKRANLSSIYAILTLVDFPPDKTGWRVSIYLSGASSHLSFRLAVPFLVALSTSPFVKIRVSTWTFPSMPIGARANKCPRLLQSFDRRLNAI